MQYKNVRKKKEKKEKRFHNRDCSFQKSLGKVLTKSSKHDFFRSFFFCFLSKIMKLEYSWLAIVFSITEVNNE